MATLSYQYYAVLSGSPYAGNMTLAAAEQSAGYTLSIATPATAGAPATTSADPAGDVVYTGYTSPSGDPILVDTESGTFFLLTNAFYANGAALTAVSDDAFACYCAGTLILTARGEIPVEDLAVGDRVLTADGSQQPVRWIGHRRLRSHDGAYPFADPLLVNPIRIRAGALGESLPRRDLLLSPEHAFLIGDILVQAGALVNDVSILREDRLPEVLSYYHVELPEHALMLAEGVAAESFVDNVNRLSFDNGAEREALAGGAPSIVEMAYPRAQSHRQVPPAIHAALMDRAHALMGRHAA